MLGERNYHVFYQLCAGLTSEERAQLHVDVPIEQLNMLNQSGCVAIDGVDDALELQRTRGPGAVGMEKEEQVHVLRTLAASLLLAQASFKTVMSASSMTPPQPRCSSLHSCLGRSMRRS